MNTREKLEGLPAIWGGMEAAGILAEIRGHGRKVVVLDDDPTGTQTVHSTTVITQPDGESIRAEFAKPDPIVYLLTNSRALSRAAAVELNRRLGQEIAAAAEQTGRAFMAVSRSDSTLRGHYPHEVDALADGLGLPEPLVFLIPAFFEGGRYTMDDVHYVDEEGALVPAGETEFARDAVFGYRSSNLCDWVKEKQGADFSADRVASVSIDALRAGPDAVTPLLRERQPGEVVVVNATDYRDLEVFALALVRSIGELPPFLFRSAAGIVPVIGGLERQPPLSLSALRLFKQGGTGRLVVVGSHVERTTRQLNQLIAENRGVGRFEIDVETLLGGGDEARQELVRELAPAIDMVLEGNGTAVLFTSRELARSDEPEESQRIGRSVADALNETVAAIRTRPRVIIAKGGITSCEVATVAQGARTADVAGQVLPGVPLWILREGSRFPGLPYVVFPGNVGQEGSLSEVLRMFR